MKAQTNSHLSKGKSVNIDYKLISTIYNIILIQVNDVILHVMFFLQKLV